MKHLCATSIAAALVLAASGSWAAPQIAQEAEELLRAHLNDSRPGEDPLAEPGQPGPPLHPEHLEVMAVELLDDGRHHVFLDNGMKPGSLRDVDLQRLSLAALEVLDRGGIPSRGVILSAQVQGQGGRQPLTWFADTPPPPRASEDRPSAGSRGSAGTDGLAGKTIYLAPCHGWTYYESLGRWSTQRGAFDETVEDLHNPEGLNTYLLPLLQRAGAEVLPLRDPGPTSPVVIIDEDVDANGVTWEPEEAWVQTEAVGWGQLPLPLEPDDAPFEAGTARQAETGTDALVRFVPDLPQAGIYPVFLSWNSAGAAVGARVTVVHPGGRTELTVDQSRHQGTWLYLGRWYFEAGRDGTRGALEIAQEADSGEPGIVADAVRFGSGTGDVSRAGRTSERPRWEEATVFYAQYAGAPPSVYDVWGCDDGPEGNDINSCDPGARPRMANWLHDPREDAVYLSWHSNACGTVSCDARGTSTYIYGNNAPDGTRPEDWSTSPWTGGSAELGQHIQDELVGTFRDRWEAGWSDRGVRTAWFAELSPSHNPNMPAALVELAFHNNPTDVQYLKEPGFRQDASRAMYRGLVRYFAERDGSTPVFVPSRPQALSVEDIGSGSVTLRWDAGPVGPFDGDAANGYLVEYSPDGHSWSTAVPVDSERTDWGPLPLGAQACFRVAAVNQGGRSLPTEAVCAAPTNSSLASVLVVGGFDRLDRFILLHEDTPIGHLRRMDVDRINNGSYAALHGDALYAAGAAFSGASNEAIIRGHIPLEDYDLVVWFLGNESSIDQTFDPDEQELLRAYRLGGGNLLISGSEVGWDLSGSSVASAEDEAFLWDVLQAGLAADSSESWEVLPSTDGPLSGAPGATIDRDGTSSFGVGWPDALAPATGAEVALQYASTENDGAALAAIDDSGSRLVFLGFPLEALVEQGSRQGLMAACLSYLLPGGWEPPGEEGPTGDDDDDDSDPPPELAPPPGIPVGAIGPEGRGCRCAGSPTPTAPPLALLLVLGCLATARRRPPAFEQDKPRP